MKNRILKEIINNSERIANLYNIGSVQRAEVEEFVSHIVRECSINSMHYDEMMEYFGLGDFFKMESTETEIKPFNDNPDFDTL